MPESACEPSDIALAPVDFTCPDLCALDAAYQIGVALTEATKIILTECNLCPPATQGPLWGPPKISPECCEQIAVGIESPGKRETDGDCWSHQLLTWTVAIGRCRPATNRQGLAKQGDQDGSTPGSVRNLTLLQMRTVALLDRHLVKVACQLLADQDCTGLCRGLRVTWIKDDAGRGACSVVRVQVQRGP